MIHWIKRHYILSIIITLAILCFVVIAVVLPHSSLLPIRTVVVQGDFTPTKQADLEKEIAPFAHGGFFSVDLNHLQFTLQQLPWISDVVVRRVWPDTIFIDIYSRQAAGLWNQESLLDVYGEVFPLNASEINPEPLPNFYGPSDATTVKVMDYYQRMNAILMPLSRAISTVYLEEDGSWAITLDNGMKMQLGSEDVLTKLRRFVKVYDLLMRDRKKQLVAVDLRYPYGLAVE